MYGRICVHESIVQCRLPSSYGLVTYLYFFKSTHVYVSVFPGQRKSMCCRIPQCSPMFSICESRTCVPALTEVSVGGGSVQPWNTAAEPFQVTEKERVEAEAEACLQKLALAERLVNGLADEYIRWQETVKNLKVLGTSFIDDCLLASAFVGYISPFNSAFRTMLNSQWMEDIKQRAIPHTDGIDPLKVLADEAAIAAGLSLHEEYER